MELEALHTSDVEQCAACQFMPSPSFTTWQRLSLCSLACGIEDTVGGVWRCRSKIMQSSFAACARN
jgi:hypothetical protein